MTADSGATWTLINDSMTGLIAVDPYISSTLYAIWSPPVPGETGRTDFYKSVDGGKTFEQSSQGIEDAMDIRGFVADPGHPGRLFVTTYAGGVFRSDDYGAHWRSMNEGLVGPFAGGIAIDPSGTHLHAVTLSGISDFTIAERDSVSLRQSGNRKPVELRERP